MWLFLVALLLPLVLIGLLWSADRLEASVWLKQRPHLIFVIVGLAELVAAVGQYLAEGQIGWGVLLPLVVGLVALAEAGRRFREAEARLPSPTPTSSDD